MDASTMFCKHCGQVIDAECIICPRCGKQVAEIKREAAIPQIVINNSNSNVNTNVNKNTNAMVGGRPKNKWVALTLCFFLGILGAHKFYEGKTGMGILYICTAGLCLVGVIIDFIALLGKPNPYYV
ncbi:MAG: TM2 domain-containing protein [Clostridia bacterium]|nr:TM2 domain-containing protein [Clostridia bacterium]